MKALITSLLFTLMSPLAIAAGTIKVYSPDSTQPKTLTDAPFLIDLVGQPRLANSWWPGAVISEGKATVIAEQRHQALLARLGALASEEEGDDAAAINSVRRQLQAVKVTGRQLVPLDPDRVRVEPTANRPLEGEYTLWVGPQPATVTVAGFVPYDLSAVDRQMAIENLTDLLANGRLSHTIGARFALDDIAGAHEAVEGGKLVGNVVLDLP